MTASFITVPARLVSRLPLCQIDSLRRYLCLCIFFVLCMSQSVVSEWRVSIDKVGLWWPPRNCRNFDAEPRTWDQYSKQSKASLLCWCIWCVIATQTTVARWRTPTAKPVTTSCTHFKKLSSNIALKKLLLTLFGIPLTFSSGSSFCLHLKTLSTSCTAELEALTSDSKLDKLTSKKFLSTSPIGCASVFDFMTVNTFLL